MWSNKVMISQHQIITPLELIGGLASKEIRDGASAIPLDIYELCELFRVRGNWERRGALKDINEFIKIILSETRGSSEKLIIDLRNEQFLMQYCRVCVSPELQKIQFFYLDTLGIGLYPLEFLRNYKAKWLVI